MHLIIDCGIDIRLNREQIRGLLQGQLRQLAMLGELMAGNARPQAASKCLHDLEVHICSCFILSFIFSTASRSWTTDSSVGIPISSHGTFGAVVSNDSFPYLTAIL